MHAPTTITPMLVIATHHMTTHRAQINKSVAQSYQKVPKNNWCTNEDTQLIINAHLDWNVRVNSWRSSPLVLIVKILSIGIPTARYAQTSCGNKETKINIKHPTNSILITHINPISISCVERIRGEQRLDIVQAGDLKQLRLLLNNLSVEGGQQRCGI